MEIHMKRKKTVPTHYSPNSYRIFNSEISDASVKNKPVIIKRVDDVSVHPREPERRNCPHPWHSRFLSHNVKILNKPICVMANSGSQSDQQNWWPHQLYDEPHVIPPYSYSTTQRADYQKHSSAKPVKLIPPQAISIQQKDSAVLLERISYRHDYNCRLHQNEPNRGKLHGSFVWEPMKNKGKSPTSGNSLQKSKLADSGLTVKSKVSNSNDLQQNPSKKCIPKNNKIVLSNSPTM
nr:uncharacterized protein C2orf73-like isoform X1 [Ciona intestinalis]|eukprot:XP_002125895.1 uncharacterized protein C2orf73-like isoform X1 [Ciona intestinalis]